MLAAILPVGGCTPLSQVKVQQSARYVKLQTSPTYIGASPYERALLLYEKGFLSDAEKQALKVVKGDDNHREAQSLLKKIDKLSFWLSSEHIEMGKLYEKAGVYSSAIDEFTIALTLNPANSKIEKRLSALKAGDLAYLEEERRAFLKARRKKEEHVRNAEKRRKRAKRRAVKEKLQATPEALALEHYRKGVAHLDADKLAPAIEELEAVTRIIPSYRDAEALLDEVRKRRDREVDVYLKKGISYFQEEELERAIEAWDMALELDPANETALDYKSRAERVMERLQEIIEGEEQ
ncbi:MAG: tetratricopeptide repeat protein [Thermodesulfobacteriota bacterium]